MCFYYGSQDSLCFGNSNDDLQASEGSSVGYNIKEKLEKWITSFSALGNRIVFDILF